MAEATTKKSNARRRGRDPQPSWAVAAKQVLSVLASLKLTVAMFALSIFIVFAGTMAQWKYGIWQVVDDYFRIDFTADYWWQSVLARIELQIFFPPSFFPDHPEVAGVFYFPKGWLIGFVLFINLLAAHAVRFKVQARGSRLAAGLVAIAAGAMVTWLVVASGSSSDGLQDTSWIPWSAFRWLLIVGAGLGAATAILSSFTLSHRSSSERITLGAVAGVLAFFVAILLYVGDDALSGSSMRILWQLIKGTGAGLVLLAGCAVLFRKRAGVVLLHAGIGLMMVNELLVGTRAVESRIRLRENETRNYAEDVRSVELAIVDPSSTQHDDVVVVPAAMLRDGAVIQHDDLPFDIEVVQFMPNSELNRTGPMMRNVATAGLGRELAAVSKAVGAGTDTNQAVDTPAAYIRFREKGSSKSLGTYLLPANRYAVAPRRMPLSPEFVRRQKRFSDGDLCELHPLQRVEHGGKTYGVTLRFVRHYKDYSIRLLDVRKDDYLGTNTPMNYSSDVHLLDASRQIDEKIHIWMNNPLRYAGETFYQSSYATDPIDDVEVTELQVVTNAGWMLPYVACMIVAVGLLTQFTVVLVRFLHRRAAEEQQTPVIILGRPETWSNGVHRYWPWSVPLLVLIFVASQAPPPSLPAGHPDIYGFGELPLVYQGRAKPFDTLARNSLLILSGKQTFRGRIRGAEIAKNWETIRAKLKAKWDKLPNAKLQKPPQSVAAIIELVEQETEDEREKIDTFVEGFTMGKEPAIRWLIDVVADTPEAQWHKVFRIENMDVQDALGVPRRKGFRYAFAEFEEKIDSFKAEVARAKAKVGATGADSLSLRERKLLHFNEKLQLYLAIREAFRIPPKQKLDTPDGVRYLLALGRVVPQLDRVPLAAPSGSKKKPWEPLTTAAGRRWLQQEAAAAKWTTPAATTLGLRQASEPLVEERIERFVDIKIIQTIMGVLRASQPDLGAQALRVRAIERFEAMPQEMHDNLRARLLENLGDRERKAFHAQVAQEIFEAVETILDGAPLDGPLDTATGHLVKLLPAYRSGDAEKFQEELVDYRESLAAKTPTGYDAAKIRFETFFNRFAPFYQASVLYLCAFVLGCVGWLGFSKPINRAAFSLTVAIMVLHAFALVSRIYISGRPPVTNLYSSAVFIGGGIPLMALILEMFFRRGIGIVVAGAAGFASLLIGHFLSVDGDTFTVLQAVLDTQFWLATHVVCVTMGYAATFLAGLLGMIYILGGVLTPSMNPDSEREVTRMIYGTLCFAIFFSFVGTVLGGLWADDSWGRFWGWDPKENGALMIVLYNVLVIHARFGRMVGPRGLAVLVVGGNIITAWSWFGVNELGVGLHSYGFTEGILMALGAFAASQLVVMAVGLLPMNLWWSHRLRKAKGPSA